MLNTNLLTFDVEEWFHIIDLPHSSYNLQWGTLEARAEPIVHQFLRLLSDYGVSCTFFILGWMAEKYPSIVKAISSSNHEIASHGYDHHPIYHLSPNRFRHDLRNARAILEDLTGSSVIGYRGPGFSITRENIWALDIISEEGFEYDATIYPGKHAHGGIPNLPSRPFVMTTPSGYALEEYPSTVINFRGFKLGFAGGGYLRLFPFAFISRCIKKLNNDKIPVMTYLHPRDLDPETPRLPMPWKRKFKCYVNVARTYKKLNKLLAEHSFCSIRDWRKQECHFESIDLRDVL